MKKYILIIAVVFVGCKQMEYSDKFHSFSDSCDKYHRLYVCSSFKTDEYFNKETRYLDSALRYYNLMYPNGNMYDKPSNITPCDCK